VLSEIYDPGWHAYIDGERTKVYQTNDILRGIAIPAGNHKIVFRYEPDSLRFGLLITTLSLIAMLAIISWVLVAWWLRRKGNSRP
jgi:uncharacterized membrane protein YfhO